MPGAVSGTGIDHKIEKACHKEAVTLLGGGNIQT